MKFFHVHSTMKEIPLSQDLRIIHVEYGEIKIHIKCDDVRDYQ